MRQGGPIDGRGCFRVLGLAVLFGMAAPCFARGAESDAPSFGADVRPMLAEHCAKCHGLKVRKGGIDLSVLEGEGSIARKRKLWRNVIRQVEAEEMPPSGEAEIPPDRRERMLAWLNGAVNTFDREDRDPGPALIRRLSLTEYNLSVRDLLGIDFDAAQSVGLPEDAGSGNDFGNLAAAMGMPPTHLEKYFAAADKALDRLFGTELASNVDGKTKKQAIQSLQVLLHTDAAPGRDSARQVIARFARRAFRRPVGDVEVDRLMTLHDRALAQGEPEKAAVRLMFKAALVSPNFLFRIERDRVPKGSSEAYRVGDHELAARLSYFLWSSTPDDILSGLADSGTLSDPEVLDAQVSRMLADPKARALTDQFAVHWLQIHKLADARPSQEFFPTFNPDLRKAMYDETATFFDKIREEDLSILDLLDADYTYLNQTLARHYKIAGVEGKEMRRVALKPDDRRGGLLGMGSILALTSHTSRTSPTMRGKWVLEVIFGTPPAPPPPDAGLLKEEKDKSKTPKTFRELMAMHAEASACASCHKKMDPLGYALDQYDAIGSWRDEAGGRPIDTSGELPGGEEFRGAGELKQIILKRKGEFVRNMTEQMLVYALGRELSYHDDGTVEEIARAVEGDGFRFSTLVKEIVRSYPFQYRRNADADDPVPTVPPSPPPPK